MVAFSIANLTLSDTALSALRSIAQNLTQTEQSFRAQLQNTTNPAATQIADQLRNRANLNQVQQQSLAQAAATVKVSIKNATDIGKTLADLRQLVVQAQQPGATSGQLQTLAQQFNQGLDRITASLAASGIGGINLLSGTNTQKFEAPGLSATDLQTLNLQSGVLTALSTNNLQTAIAAGAGSAPPPPPPPVTTLQGANFEGANLQGVNFAGVNLTGANFEGANLQGANFAGANLSGANFEGANLQNANLQGANIQNAFFREANLNGTILQNNPPPNVPEPNFQEPPPTTGQEFERQNLQGANFAGQNLQGAEFDRSRLQNATFTSANLAGASFENVNAQGANFGGANLTRANFEEANLQGANFQAPPPSGGGGSGGSGFAGVLGSVDAAIAQVSKGLGVLNRENQSIQDQIASLSKLNTTLNSQIGSLVQTDLTPQRAQIAALQLGQQLSQQIVGITGHRAQSVLGTLLEGAVGAIGNTGASTLERATQTLALNAASAGSVLNPTHLAQPFPTLTLQPAQSNLFDIQA